MCSAKYWGVVRYSRDVERGGSLDHLGQYSLGDQSLVGKEKERQLPDHCSGELVGRAASVL